MESSPAEVRMKRFGNYFNIHSNTELDGVLNDFRGKFSLHPADK